jgi:hypothetical protein
MAQLTTESPPHRLQSTLRSKLLQDVLVYKH